MILLIKITIPHYDNYGLYINSEDWFTERKLLRQISKNHIVFLNYNGFVGLK